MLSLMQRGGAGQPTVLPRRPDSAKHGVTVMAIVDLRENPTATNLTQAVRAEDSSSRLLCLAKPNRIHVGWILIVYPLAPNGVKLI